VPFRIKEQIEESTKVGLEIQIAFRREWEPRDG
jgi:hypothetical protein